MQIRHFSLCLEVLSCPSSANYHRGNTSRILFFPHGLQLAFRTMQQGLQLAFSCTMAFFTSCSQTVLIKKMMYKGVKDRVLSSMQSVNGTFVRAQNSFLTYENSL